MINMANNIRIRYRPSFETDREIIKVLALEKEFAQYDLPKRIGKNYRTVLRHLKDLKKDGLIKLSRTEESAKGGKERNIFTLTEYGLLYALGYSNIWPNIDKVASNYGEILPLIFGKWDLYIEKGLRNEIIARLQAVVQGFFMQLGREWYRIVKADSNKEMKIRLQKLESKEVADRIMVRHRSIAPTFTHRVLGLSPFLDLGQDSKAIREQQSFIKTLIEDPQLRQYYDEEFDYLLKQAKLEHEGHVQALKWYNELKSSNKSMKL